MSFNLAMQAGGVNAVSPAGRESSVESYQGAMTTMESSGQKETFNSSIGSEYSISDADVSDCSGSSPNEDPDSPKKTSKAKKKKNRKRDRERSKSDMDQELDRALSSYSLGSAAEDVHDRRRSISPAAATFIKAECAVSYQNSSGEHRETLRGRIWRIAESLINDNYLANLTALVVLFDAWLTCYDIDSKAIGDETPFFVSLASDLCLVVYTLELCLFFMVKGIRIMKIMYRDTLFMIDLTVLICGYAEALLQAFGMNDFFGRIGMLRLLRVARILRLTRILRKSQSLKELRRLLTMMATCMKALAWSFLICFGVMSFWAMLMVEIIHPIVKDSGDLYFADCEQCRRATQSVMDANLLLFKTVIAGDSWGLIAVPVIEDHPGTAIIFVGSQLTLVFGVLNLIVAVVVDTFAESRAHDVLNLAEELEQEMASDKKSLQKMFERIDDDSSGTVTVEELIAGARKDPELQSRLAVMDIDEVDLEQLFEMIDVEGTGQVHARDFIGPLSRWVRDSKTAPRFVKYNLMRMMERHDTFQKTVDLRFEHLARTLDEMFDEFRQGFQRTDSRSCSTESFSPGGVSPKGFTPKGSSPKGSQSLQAQFRQIRMQKAVDHPSDVEVDEVEQPHISARAVLQLTPSADSMKLIQEDLEASFQRAMQVLRKSLLESMTALKQTSAITETTVSELFESTSRISHVAENNQHKAQPIDLDNKVQLSEQWPDR